MVEKAVYRRLRRHDLIKIMRNEIVGGNYGPGELIPTRTALLERFGVAPATLQKAMDVLIAEGFLSVTASRYGTRVSEYPPHLYYYTMVLPPQPHFASQYYKAIIAQAEKINREGPYHISIFEGVAGHDDFERYQKVADDVKFRRTKGIFFATSANEYARTPLLQQTDMPRFAIADSHDLPKVPKANFSLTSFFQRAILHLKQKNVKRVAVLTQANLNRDWTEKTIVEMLGAVGFPTDMYLIQCMTVLNKLSARHCTELMLQLPPERLPDGLIIADDNLVEAVTGQISAHSALAARMEIVAHANFPLPTTCHLPATRLGFDVERVFCLGMDAIDAQSKGESVPMFRDIPAVFEDELPGS